MLNLKQIADVPFFGLFHSAILGRWIDKDRQWKCVITTKNKRIQNNIVDYGTLMLIEEHEQIERQTKRSEEDTRTRTKSPMHMQRWWKKRKHDANTKPTETKQVSFRYEYLGLAFCIWKWKKNRYIFQSSPVCSLLFWCIEMCFL